MVGQYTATPTRKTTTTNLHRTENSWRTGKEMRRVTRESRWGKLTKSGNKDWVKTMDSGEHGT